MSQPAVSIIVPALNEGKNIRACLRSLKAQDYAGKTELIVCDGHSSDATAKLARKEGAKVVFERKHSIAAGRQTGARSAKGGILVFFDADGVAERSWLSELVGPFESPRVVSAHGNLFMDGGNFFDDLFCKTLFPLYLWLANAIGVPSGTGSNLAVRAGVFRKSGGFDTDLITGEDLVLQKKLRAFGKTVFVRSAVVRVSKRRILKWGYVGYGFFHVKNWLRLAFGMKPKAVYEPVRD